LRNAEATPALMIGLGEVLWDILPSGTTFGGAPANFAYMTTVLGDRGVVASRVCNDELGIKARRHMQELGLNTSYIQEDDRHPTGTAEVQIDDSGQPTFTIRESVAWDYLEWTPAWEELASKARVVCFGSLAQRSPASARTIERFLQAVPKDAVRICDINLRAPFYDFQVVDRCLRFADILKLNDYELLKMSALLNLSAGNEETLAKQLLRAYELRLLCLTRGPRGSLLVASDEIVDHPGFKVKVADAVGAGDAFTACLAHHYLLGESLEVISNVANRFASWVTTQAGATPVFDNRQLHEILNGDLLLSARSCDRRRRQGTGSYTG
jgi:fructokinase